MTVFSWGQIANPDFSLRDFFPDIASDAGSALTIGAFDGPHLGHRTLFGAVLGQKNLLHGIITFSRSPRALKDSGGFQGDVSTLRLRLERFELLGFDFVAVIDFSRDFSKISGRDFLSVLRQSLHMRFLAVGPFFRCGYKLDTGMAEIASFAAEYGLVFAPQEEVSSDGRRISSTLIRQAAAQGDFGTVRKLLGFSYRLDAACLPQEKNSDGFTCALSAVTQIIPPVGQYEICAAAAKESEENAFLRLAGTLIVDTDSLRCRVPGLSAGFSVQTIIFGNPEGIE